MNQTGQALLIVLLATLVALTIGISLAQRSISDLSNSAKLDDAGRALAAAEAGLERGLITPSNFTIDPSVFGNQSSANVKSSGLVPSSTYPGAALSYPPIDRSTFAQFWFADPASPGAPTQFYNPNNYSFNLYFADPTLYPCGAGSCPSIAITLIIQESGSYKFQTSLHDSRSISSCNGNQIPAYTYSIDAENPAEPLSGLSAKKYLCKYTISYPPAAIPILLRARLLISNSAQPIAIEPTGGASLPPQVTILSSTGTAGQSERRLRLFSQIFVEPIFFDYAIFSNGDILK